jgi:mono/diheme cytochrome c family protein
MVFALSTGHQIGLAATGAAFIVFALISSFVLPARNPNFPGGRGLRWYLPLAFAFFIAMMAAVFVFGRESKAKGEGEAAAATTAAATTTATTTGGGGMVTSGPYANGDATAGAAVFKKAGCVACHTLEAAGATGTVGPNLDEKKPGEALIIERVVNGKKAMPPFKSSLSQKQIADVVAYVYTSTHS